MKKIIAIFLVVLLSVSVLGCTAGKGLTDQERKKAAQSKEELKYAKNLIKEYLELTMQGNFEKSKEYIDIGSKTKKMIEVTGGPKRLGYKIKSVDKVGNNIVASVDLILCQKASPYYSVDSMNYVIGKKEGSNKMIIIDKEQEGSLAFFEETVKGEKAFMMSAANISKGNPLFEATDLPTYLLVKRALQLQRKVPVSRDSFGAISIAPNNKQMVITSVKDGNTILIMVERLLTVFNDNSLVTAEGGEKGGTNKGPESTEELREIEVRGMDYFENSTVEYITFSPGECAIYTQIRSGDKVSLAIYSSYSKDILTPKIMEKFNSPEYTINNAYFNNDDVLILQVKNIKENKTENYILYLKTDKFVKMDH